MLTSYRTRFDNLQADWKHPYASCGVCPSPQLNSSVGAAFLLQELMREKEKNKVLQAQVSSLESIVEDLRNQAQQYNSEAISSELRIHELETELDESQKREAGLISADRLEAAIEKVAELEELLQVQTDMKALAKAPEEEVAHLVVENVALRERLHVTETMLSNAKVPLSDQIPDEELAYALVEAAACREKIADPFVHVTASPDSASPSSELASALVEASQLRAELAALKAANPIHAAISSFRKEAFEAVECTRQEIERIRILHSSSPVESSIASITTTISPQVESPEWPSSSRCDLDDDLAYALIENYNLREMLNSTK